MTTATQTKIVLYFLAILIGSWSANAAEVTLRPQSHAKGSLVLLGDVAEVKSTDAERAARLKRVELFPAPAQHRSKLMHVRELVELLVLHGIDINGIEFTGARTTRIYAPTQEPKVVVAGLLTPTVKATEMVVVTRRTLNRGDIIRDADVELQPIDPKAPRFQVANERRAVVGMELLSPLREGQTINLSQLRKPLLVKRGEVIRVRARAAGVQVTTTARATEDGSLGDIIMVQSLENREKYPTHVTGLHQVEVYATGVIAADPARPTAQPPSLLTEKR
ncbi:MAG: flagellar basal body P-ring formation chaperone FlgA [Planctomycetota bacterium]|nr:flagellar basal body P-ring formation chaperone FlgA [Planctomycetota bacterium]